MTIKPVVVAPSQKRSGTSSSDTDKKESHQNSNVGDVVSNPLNQHRNVVIDAHGQSPQRRGVDVYDDLARHRRSPHKSSRHKRRDHTNDPTQLHHKRERAAGATALSDKHGNVTGLGVSALGKCNSPHSSTAVSVVAGVAVSNSPVTHSSSLGNKSPDHLLKAAQSSQTQSSAGVQAASGLLKAIEDNYSGYNSGDEHLQPKEGLITADEWQKKDEQFAKCMADRGYILKPVEEDGACLFRSISLQIYGDEEMHDVIRQHTMDYIYKNREYFSHFVTEDINSYIKRKRRKDSHGNHIEIQAMSEIYSRPVEVYCYKPTPINIFNSEQCNNGYAPLRLSYQRGSHYNAIIDPYNATVGVGLGLAGYKPELQTKEAVRLSEQLEIEQTMFEDKLKTTDWEATNEAIEEQIARESYLQWCRENLQKNRNNTTSTSAAAASTSSTITSGEAIFDAEASPSKYAIQRLNVNSMSSNSSSSSTTTQASSSATTTNCNSNNISNSNNTSNNSTTLNNMEQYVNLSPKHFSTSVSHSKKSDDMSGGFDSDDTDMSSTSSISGNKICEGATSPSATGRSKKSKNRNIIASNATKKQIKKRRRDITHVQTDDDARLHKSPKHERSCTPDIEHQQPCTSKQLHTPEKHNKHTTNDISTAAMAAETLALPSSSSTKHNCSILSNSAKSSTSTSSSPTTQQQTYSSFYQELLEASYANDGFGQLSESEMLQRAIQMSTHDYIEDQKRKYLYGP